MSDFGDGHDDENSQFFPQRDVSGVNSRILLTAIISLSVVVVVVLMLHIYARFMLRRQARRRAAIQELRLIARVHSNEPPKRGLDPSVIASLPILMYKDVDGLDQTGCNPECAVCLSKFEDGQMVRVLPNCMHHFHAECIDKWLGSQPTCPICRQEAEPGPTIPPLPREPSTRQGWSPSSAPPLEHTSSVAIATEGTSDHMVQSSTKVNATNSRLSSFRRMLSMDRSSRRVNSCAREEGVVDLERQ